MELRGLDGVSARSVEAVVATSKSGVLTLLGDFRGGSQFVTATGQFGALVVWRDDAGLLRAEFMSHCVTRSKWCGKSKSELRRWLDEWFTKLGR